MVAAADLGLNVVPLIQTFGHMEFVLKHKQWQTLREVDIYPSSMCPSNSAALPLITNMIKQIVTFHPDLQYLHIGADEESSGTSETYPVFVNRSFKFVLGCFKSFVRVYESTLNCNISVNTYSI